MVTLRGSNSILRTSYLSGYRQGGFFLADELQIRQLKIFYPEYSSINHTGYLRDTQEG